jgi:hypothetical protein
MSNMEELGMGVLDWDREERILNRYGFVKVLDQPGPVRRAIHLLN